MNWSAIASRLSRIEKSIPPPVTEEDRQWRVLIKRVSREQDPALIAALTNGYIQEMEGGAKFDDVVDPEIPLENLALTRLSPDLCLQLRAFIAGPQTYREYCDQNPEVAERKDRMWRAVGLNPPDADVRTGGVQ